MASKLPASRPAGAALLQMGFRPFFLFGSLFSLAAVALWLSMTAFGMQWLRLPTLSPAVWHGHEMIFGYALAVVAGFLLTAVRNWTGVQTVQRVPLLLLVIAWLAARLMPFVGHPLALPAMAALDLGFNVALCIAVLQPIARAGQRRQLGLWLQLVAIMIANAIFYCGLAGLVGAGVRVGLYTGLYVIISVMLLVARRVLPMFIENGVGYPVALTNHRWLDIASVILMLVFIVAAAILQQTVVTAVCAVMLFLMHIWRLAGWYTSGIWKRPLLWVLYLAYGWIAVGFALIAACAVLDLDSRLATHAFAYGGIGLMTLGMMVRVTLGHTGRDVGNPPGLVVWSFLVLLAGVILRVILPLVAPGGYALWITGAQACWLVAFMLFAWQHATMLSQPRIDGKAG